jgi:hypothetical protein
MDKSSDKYKFQCPECGECFTTKQNLRRHITRKHKEVVWESVVEGPPTSVNELIETNSLVSITLDDRGVEPHPQLEPIPGDDYLLHLRNEYNKYKHLYTSIDNRIRWNQANRNIDMEFYIRRHNTKMKYILFKINLLNANIN